MYQHYVVIGTREDDPEVEMIVSIETSSSGLKHRLRARWRAMGVRRWLSSQGYYASVHYIPKQIKTLPKHYESLLKEFKSRAEAGKLEPAVFPEDL